MRLLLLFMLSLTSLSLAHGQDEKRMRAQFTTEEIVVDGRLDEAVWSQAERVSRFTQRELQLGEAASERTEVAIAYDEHKLYVAVWCYDSSPNKLIARELRRDFDYSLDDNFMVIIDTYHDKRNGFLFVTNPNAARFDAQVYNNGASTNAFWNGVWDVKRGLLAKVGLPSLKSRSTP